MSAATMTSSPTTALTAYRPASMDGVICWMTTRFFTAVPRLSVMYRVGGSTVQGRHTRPPVDATRRESWTGVVAGRPVAARGVGRAAVWSGTHAVTPRHAPGGNHTGVAAMLRRGGGRGPPNTPPRPGVPAKFPA